MFSLSNIERAKIALHETGLIPGMLEKSRLNYGINLQELFGVVIGQGAIVHRVNDIAGSSCFDVNRCK